MDPIKHTLEQYDKEILDAIVNETARQSDKLELIASENFVSYAVIEALGSTLTNKYAEGYPGKRYYGGCEYVDVAENLARERAKQLFRGRVCKCAASLRKPGKHGGLFYSCKARRQGDGHGPFSWRTSYSRLSGKLFRPALQFHSIRDRS
jgi:hypothetical protein